MRRTGHGQMSPTRSIQTPTEVLATVNKVAASDLARFKDFIEARGPGTTSRARRLRYFACAW
jgi:hypothetical protein